jgi:PTH1 family peptidyl-tRNA hydrolase
MVKVPVENALVITNDLTLPEGKLRLKPRKDPEGGHNGLKDIELNFRNECLRTAKFGIGSDFGRGRQTDYVLTEFSNEG